MKLIFKKISFLFALLIMTDSGIYSQEISVSDSLKHVLKQNITQKERLETIKKLAYILYKQNPIESSQYCVQGIQLAQKAKNKRIEATFNLILGNLNFEQNNLDEAASFYHKSLMLSEEEDDVKGIANAYSNLANISDNYKLKLTYYDRAIEYFKQSNDSSGIQTAYNNIGVSHDLEGKLDLAKTYYQKSLNIAHKIKDEEGVGYALCNIGEVLVKQQQQHTALKYFSAALKSFKSKNVIRGVAITYKNFGYAYLEMGNYQKSELYLKMGEKIAKDASYSGLLLDVYDLRAKLYKKKHDLENAILYSEKIINLKDTVNNLQKEQKTNAMLLQFEIERQKKQIEILERDKKINKLQTYVLLGVIAFFIVLVFLIFYVQKAKIKKNKIIYEKTKKISEQEKELIENRLKNAKLEKQLLEDEVKIKNNELTNFANYILEKNIFLKKVKSEIKELKKTVKNPSSIKVVNELSMRLNQNLSIDKERKEFEMHAQEINRGFLESLNDKYTELTISEKRLITLLLFNLSSNEIASLMNISTSSVHTKRYRLRKKLDIPEKTEIIDFIRQNL